MGRAGALREAGSPRKGGPAHLARCSRMCMLRSKPGLGEARTITKTMRNTAPAAMPATVRPGSPGKETP